MAHSDPGSSQEQSNLSKMDGQKESAESESLLLENLEEISGGVIKKPIAKTEKLCATGLLTTCKVDIDP